MMGDLFSTFDPQTSIGGWELGLNWLSVGLGVLFMPLNYWLKTSRLTKMFLSSLSFIVSEFKVILGGKKYGSYHLFISIFMMIFSNNLLGMFPYIFTSSSHMVFTLSLSMSLWFSFMTYGWLNFTNFMFCHLVPMGTPGPLMPFMVCIETISNVIRPGTLAVRLSANMISGHLLLALMGGQGNKSLLICLVLLITQMMLLTLEFSVSIIQAYVFSILSALYSSECTAH